MAVEELTRIQGGSYNPSTGVWTEVLGNFQSVGGALEYWLQFNHATILDQKGGPLVTAFTVTVIPTFTETATLAFYALNRPVRASFATGANAPRPRTSAFHSFTQTLTTLTPVVLTVPLNTTTGGATPIDAQLVHRLPANDGTYRTALGISWSGAGGTISVTLPTVTHQPGFTGLSGPWLAQGRADECPTCGKRSTRDTWVRDGWTGLMVCARCYDPPDPLGRRVSRGERPPVGEG